MTIKLGLRSSLTQDLLKRNNISFSGQGEFGDSSNQIIQGVNLNYPSKISASLITNSQSNEVLMYPNPAANLVQFFNVDNSRICIYDMSGRLLIDKMIFTAQCSIGISNLSSGTYSVRIEKGHDKIYKKLVVLKP